MTASSDAAYAEQIADKIRNMNDNTFSYGNQEIPLTLHVTTISLKECHSKDEVFSGLHSAIDKSKM